MYATREPGDKASQLISPTGSTLNLSLKSPEVAITPDPDDADDNKDKLTVLVIDKIIDVVCSAYHPPREDDKPNAVTSQLEQLIVKVLMTALSSSTAHLHGHHLLKAVRTVYNVYLLTKDKLNHNTLRVSLAQLITIVFQRMEGFAEVIMCVCDCWTTNRRQRKRASLRLRMPLRRTSPSPARLSSSSSLRWHTGAPECRSLRPKSSRPSHSSSQPKRSRPSLRRTCSSPPKRSPEDRQVPPPSTWTQSSTRARMIRTTTTATPSGRAPAPRARGVTGPPCFPRRRSRSLPRSSRPSSSRSRTSPRSPCTKRT